ncbi:LysR family transcriptional regulator [Limnohabitans radicicola]|uniref:LysR family transcriptional regulator n=1 Tax=Limnohabitans radicicola TaxID=2771427 RepID=A0A927FIY1_9BURK|nr:LysR family transcriptional regulator [Limnohabitans radicicola]MBD8051362.1 LysR family transcriptional regulator [Limnohabitans radicicola]
MDRLQSMRVFESVVDEGGFAAAARALDMSAPVVTRLVADLEEHLGTRLLQRSTRRLSLTEAGQQYLSRIRHILQDIDEADAMASSHTTEMAGVLRIQAPPVLATYVVAPLLGRFRSQYPAVRIELHVSPVAEPAIEDFDITLLGTDDNFDADIVARKVIESEAFLVASPAYLQRRGEPRRPEELARHDCLRLKLPQTRPRTWRLWRPQQEDQWQEVEVQPVLLSNHMDTLLRAALDGAGIMSLPLDIAAPYLSQGTLVRVLSPWITGRLALYAALPSRKFIPDRTRVFLEYLIEQTKLQTDKALKAFTSTKADSVG